MGYKQFFHQEPKLTNPNDTITIQFTKKGSAQKAKPLLNKVELRGIELVRRKSGFGE